MLSSYDNVVSAIAAGQKLVLPWQKASTTTPAANYWYHLWPVTGFPASGSYSGSNLIWQPTTDLTTGAFYHGGNVSPSTKHLIYALVAAGINATPAPVLMLVDMSGYYPLVQSASPQSFDNSTNGAPTRYISSGQPGLQIALVNTAAMGGASANISALTYVNQAGTSGHAISTTPTMVATSNANAPTITLGAQVLTKQQGAGPFLPLQAGDTGVRSLTSITFSAANSGGMALVLCKPLAFIPVLANGGYTERDLILQIAGMERIYDGACLTWFAFFSSAISAAFIGEIDVAWGS